MAARGFIRQKPIDQCYNEKCLQSRVHPARVALVSGECHCNNRQSESLLIRCWQRQTDFFRNALPLRKKPDCLSIRKFSIGYNGKLPKR